MPGLQFAVLTVFVLFAIGGCSDKKPKVTKKAELESADIKSVPEDVEHIGKYLPFYDENEIVQNLQGSWVFDTEIMSVASAWSFKEREFLWITRDAEGKLEPIKTGTLEVVAPCKIGHVVGSEGMSATNYRNILATKEGVFEGSSMGERRGSDFVVCTSHGVFAGTAKGCYLWDRSVFGRYSRQDASCRFAEDGEGAERFYGESGDAKVDVQVFGDLIASWPPKQLQGRRVAGPKEAALAVAQ